MKTCSLLGVPMEAGASQPGCLMGPASLRTAGLAGSIEALGWCVTDLGDVRVDALTSQLKQNSSKGNVTEIHAWIQALTKAAYSAARDFDLPIFLGGDHTMSAGTVPGVARHAGEAGKPLFVLWLDAHPDLHSLNTTRTGNLHGTPVAYYTGQDGFDGYPPLANAVPTENLCFIGIRSVDEVEHDRIQSLGLEVHDMRSIDEHGIIPLLRRFLDRVTSSNGLLHVSFDVDFLDPTIAPAVGTTVPGGASFREAHLIMETLCDSGLVTSLDLVELNPFLDERGRTALLLCDLAASLMGRRVLDRPTRSYG